LKINFSGFVMMDKSDIDSSIEETVRLILKVVCQSNKKQYDTFTHENFPVFQCVKALRRYLLATFKDELAPAASDEAFRMGYIGSKNRKLTIASPSQLSEAYSNAKDGWLMLWTDRHLTTPKPSKDMSNDSASGVKRKHSHVVSKIFVVTFQNTSVC
jgi:hypothetical protein